MVKEVIDNIKTYTDKVLPLISAICEKINLSKIVDDQLEAGSKDKILSTGTVIKAIVMNIVT